VEAERAVEKIKKLPTSNASSMIEKLLLIRI
jgi:hypothetical protein